MCYNMGCPHESLSGKCSGIPRSGCPMENEEVQLGWIIEPQAEQMNFEITALPALRCVPVLNAIG